MDVVIYSRVSTEDQKDFGFSLQDQERRLREYCKIHGYNIVRHYEEDYSAKNFARPKFQRFLSELTERKIKPTLFICVRPDRFSRNFEESIAMLSHLKKHGITIRYLENDIILDTPESKLPYMVQLLIPEIDNARRAINTINGMRQAMRSGRFPWKAPKGYKNDTTSKTIDISDNAPLITKAFIEIAKGVNDTDVVRRELLKEGLKCSKQQFQNLLRNPFYIGKIIIKAYKNEPETIVKGLHPPLIDEVTFYQVQNVLSGKRRSAFKPSRLQPEFPLRGHLVCCRCGNKLTGSKSKGRSKKYCYYHCQHGCKERFDAIIANDIFTQYLASLEIDSELGGLYKVIVKDVFEQEEGSREKQIGDVEKQLIAIRDKLNNLDDKLAEDKISDEDYRRISVRYKSELQELSVRKNTLSNNVSNLEKHFAFGISMMTHLHRYYEFAPLEVKHKIVDSIFDSKLFFDGKKYRTENSSIFLTLKSLLPTYKKGVKTKQATNFGGLSTLAPPPGLEPGTP